MQIFKYEGREVRTVILNDEIWFVAKDVAEVMGYTNPSKAIGDHVDDDDKGVTKCYTLGGTQELNVINESGLYSFGAWKRRIPSM